MILTVTLNASVDKMYMVDEVKLNSVMRVRQAIPTAGGKGLNVSRVAAAFGEKVLATGFLGGFSGEYIQSLLEKDGIASDFVKIEGETRSCINVVDLATGKHTEFLEPGAKVSGAEQQAFLERYKKYLPLCSVTVLSGSLPQGVSAEYYGTLISLAKEQGKKVILDTSGEPLKQSLVFRPTLIKPNADEIRQLCDLPDVSLESLQRAAFVLNRRGIANVIISLGEKGSLAACEEGIFLCDSPCVDVVNTVGCGDSMVAGFAVGLARGYSFEDTLRIGVAAAAANAPTKTTGRLRPADLQQLRPLVNIRRLDDI
ncbi:1-phosphofructokinase [Caproiciproducens galactitolivorans]|uniref:1-phosphofructokinase n=1 Tax=Caproiciproducens galactitolivorans TaxID=642589 RepID=UPI002409E3AB|nr:1-phosphofructokinase [Caproiciproducens galactitolivorans]